MEQHRHYEGMGRLLMEADESVAIDVSYTLHESWQVYGSGTTGVRRQRAELPGAPIELMRELFDNNHDLILELEDGRRWRCVLTNENGSLASRGGGITEPAV